MGGGSKVIYHHFLFRQAVIGRTYGQKQKHRNFLRQTQTEGRKPEGRRCCGDGAVTLVLGCHYASTSEHLIKQRVY